MPSNDQMAMDLTDFETVKNILEYVSPETQKSLKVALKQYVEFSKVTPNGLLAEAKANIGSAQTRMVSFYRWLQGLEIEGYPKREKGVKESSAYQMVFSTVRSFYVYNNIAFEKRWSKKIPKPKGREAIRNDNNYDFYKVDEDERKIYFDRELLQRFLSNLKLRDQAITLALLSSSLDSGELLKLDIGDVRRQNRKRLFLDNSQEKTGVLYRTFLSTEATTYIRRYIDQERQGVRDDEPLFVFTRHETNPEEKRKEPKLLRMTPRHLSSVYRDTAKKIGIQWKDDEWNPLRPKRLRYLFRTACDRAGVSEFYINCYMGYANSMGQDYSEISPAKLELEYLRVEPFLMIYGEIEEGLKTKEDVCKLKIAISTLTDEVMTLRENHISAVREYEGTIDKIMKRLRDLEDFRQRVLTEESHEKNT